MAPRSGPGESPTPRRKPVSNAAGPSRPAKTPHDLASTLLDIAPALVVVLDKQGTIVRLNPSCERLSGWSLDEVHGKVFCDVFCAPDEAETLQATFMRVV